MHILLLCNPCGEAAHVKCWKFTGVNICNAEGEGDRLAAAGTVANTPKEFQGESD